LNNFGLNVNLNLPFGEKENNP